MQNSYCCISAFNSKSSKKTSLYASICSSISPGRSCPVPVCVWGVPPSSALCSAAFPDHVHRNPPAPSYLLPYETRNTVSTSPGDPDNTWSPTSAGDLAKFLCYPDLEELRPWRTSAIGNVRSEMLSVSLPASKHHHRQSLNNFFYHWLGWDWSENSLCLTQHYLSSVLLPMKTLCWLWSLQLPGDHFLNSFWSLQKIIILNIYILLHNSCNSF